MSRWLVCRGRPLVLALVMLLLCCSCSASTSTSSGGAQANRSLRRASCFDGLEALGDSPTRATRDSRQQSACGRVARLCRWSIAFSQFRTHTNPGTFVTRPPGSCPAGPLAEILQLAVRIRRSGPHGRGLCDLFEGPRHTDLQNQAMQFHQSCGEMALGTNGITQIQLAQPVSYVILFSSRPGPPHWAAYLGFASPKLKSVARYHLRPPGVPAPVNTALVKRPNGGWAIFQLRYEP